MKRCGPPLKDRRDKRLTERSARERAETTYWECDSCGEWYNVHDDDGVLCRECHDAALNLDVPLYREGEL